MHVLLISTLWLLRHRMSTLWLLRHRLYFESQSSSCCMSTKLYTAWMSTYKCTNTYIHIHTYTYIHTYIHAPGVPPGGGGALFRCPTLPPLSLYPPLEGHLRCKLIAGAPLPPPLEGHLGRPFKVHQRSRLINGQGSSAVKDPQRSRHTYTHACIHALMHTYTYIYMHEYIHIHDRFC